MGDTAVKPTPSISPEQKAKLIEELERRLPESKCPMCGNRQFTIVEGYFTNTIQPRPGAMLLGGPAIPAAAIICGNCGFISQHALGVLGLLPTRVGDQ